MSYNCSSIRGDGSSCFGQLTPSGNGCEPCDTEIENENSVSDGFVISKTRGVPGMGSTKYLTGLLSVGVLFFIVGYGLQKGKLIA